MDQMMWIGNVRRTEDGHEFWTMRPEIRNALASLDWYLSPSQAEARLTTSIDRKASAAAQRFETSHGDAFRALGAMAPGQHWSAFDVSMDEAEMGKATVLVTTIWNYLETPQDDGKVGQKAAIVRDRDSGSLWYELAAQPSNTDVSTMKAHRRRIEIALRHGVPIVGFLKDLESGRASLQRVFDCTRLAKGKMKSAALWVELVPREVCELAIDEVRMTDVASIDRHLPIPDPAAQFETEVESARRRSSAARRARLLTASKKPQRIEILTTTFLRNPDVVAEVLEAAKGVCGQCGKAAPFLRNGAGSPYLEVHHKIPLALGGDDTVDNAVALCPNCHRWFHYGQQAPAS